MKIIDERDNNDIASFIFKSKLELALSIILKERELYESKHVVVAFLDVFISGIDN